MPTPTPAPVEDHLPRIQRVVDRLVRRKGLSEEEGEEFAGHVRLKMVEDDGEILRRYRGESSLEGYLATVVARLFLDWSRARWGRWRPSAAAKRRGPVAVQLERLLHRDRVPFDQAAEILRRNHGVGMSVAELAELAGELPPPSPSARRLEQEPDDEAGGLERVAPPGQSGADVERRVEEAELERTARRTGSALRRALDRLDRVDRFLVRSFVEGLKVSEVARMLGEEQKPLYRRRERLLPELRQALEDEGVTAADAAALLDWGQAEMDAGLRENRP